MSESEDSNKKLTALKREIRNKAGERVRTYNVIWKDIYGFEASEDFISDVTDKIMPQIEDWQNRPLSEVYPVL